MKGEIKISSVADFRKIALEDKERRGVSDGSLGERVGVSPAWIWNTLHGVRMPSLKTALGILDAFGFEVIARRREGAEELPVLRDFSCAMCGKDVVITKENDRRTTYCCVECERRFWKHKQNAARHGLVNNLGVGRGMSLSKLKWREKMDLD